MMCIDYLITYCVWYSDNRVFGKQPLQDDFVAEVATAPSVLHVALEVSTLFLH